MTQLSSAILGLQTESVFAREYAKGTHKSTYWDHSYEDMMNLIARLPEVRKRSEPCNALASRKLPGGSVTGPRLPPRRWPH